MNKQYKEQIKRLHTSEGFEENTIAMLLNEAGKDKPMFKTKYVKIILAAVIGIFLLSGTVFAIAHYFTASDVAKINGAGKLAGAFESDDAITINKTVEVGEYRITLLGIISGKELTYWSDIDEARSYIAVTASYLDGRKIESAVEDVPHFTIAFDGVAPWMYPSEDYCATADGEYLYCLIDAVNLEPFADRNVKLFAFDKYTFPTGEVFSFNQETGKLSYNEKYDGIRAVFDLPLDESKADAEEASRILANRHVPQP